MNKGISKIGLTALLAVLIVLTTVAFIFVTTRKNRVAQNTPTPSITQTYQTYTPQPIESATPNITASPSPSTTPSVTPSPSGIKGLATLKSCTSGNCITKAVSQMKIDVKTSTGMLVTTLTTDSAGRYTINLPPGEYLVGPFVEPSSSATVNATTVKVNRGYFSEVNVKFESSL